MRFIFKKTNIFKITIVAIVAIVSCLSFSGCFYSKNNLHINSLINEKNFNNQANSNMPKYDTDKEKYSNENTYNNETHSTLKNGYQDYSPISNYVGNGYVWNGPIYAPYAGIDTSNDQDLINFVQNTQIKHIILSFATIGYGNHSWTFPDGTTDTDFGPDNSNTAKWSSNNQAGPILPHWDIIKQLRDLGVDVGIGFGGSGDTQNFFRFAPSISGLARWYEDLILGYGIHNGDWDIEGKAASDYYDINRLAQALNLVYHDLKKRNYAFHIQFTVESYYHSWLADLDNLLGDTNYTINSMFTPTSAQDIEYETQYLKDSLNSFSSLSDTEIHHRLGFTNPFLGDSYKWDFKSFLELMKEEQIGFISIFSLQQDLATNSYDNWGNHNTGIDQNDYDVSKEFEKIEINRSWGNQNQKMNGEIKNLHVYYAIKNDPDNSQYLGSCIKWNEVLNADYYQVIFNDHDKEITYETTRTNIFLPTNSASNYSIEVIAHNVNNDQTITSNKLDFSVADNALNQPLHYYDITANFWTGTGPESDLYSQGKGYLKDALFYYKNKIYQLINDQYGNYKNIEKKDRETKLPNKNTTSFKLLTNDLDNCGYSEQALTDLKNFTIKKSNYFEQYNINDGYFLIQNYSEEEHNVKELLINQNLYEKYSYK